MKYNKSSTHNSIKRANSKGTKIKNKVGLSGWKIFLIAFIALIVIVCAAALGVIKSIIDTAPDISHMDVIPTGYSTTVLADDGVTEIQTLVGSGANREYVTLDQIPLHMQQAFIAIEDMRFYEHNGIDLQGIARAGVATIKSLVSGSSGMQGASTITQQLIKNNVLTSWTGETTLLEKLQRKIQEQYLAVKLEKQVQDKDWILENYLNTINLGSNTLGVQSAANKYFGKDVSELTLSESAVIAGITQNPYGYNPIRFPEENAKRTQRVLTAMLEQGYISQRQYNEAIADPVYERIAAYNNIETSDSYNTYFVDALIEDVLNDLMEKKGYSQSDAYKAIYQGGLTIISSQNLTMQAICDEEANNLDNYPTKPRYSFNLSFSVKQADGTTKTYSHQTMLSYYKKVNNNAEYDITYATEEECYNAIAEYEQAMLAEGGTIVEGSESILITLQPQVAMTVIDQSTGEVKALVGGRGDKVGNRTWNRATDTTRQPGSTFKIMACYAPALDAGGKTLASVQDDAPFSVGGKDYKNAGSGKFYGWTTLREGITKSYNITTVKTLQDIGVNLGYEYAQNFGITTLTETDKTLGLALGGLTYGVTNLELTAAYATVANAGQYIEPSFYTKVYDHEGNLILTNTTQETRQVISEQTAWLLTDAMRDVMTSGTGTKAYFGGGMDQAGKTGTTTYNRDSLFAGYTPYYTCVVWGGNDDNSKQKDSECTYARAIWRESMKRIHAELGLENKTFEKPSGITSASVCRESGRIPLEETCKYCQKGNPIYTEYFATGTVPVEKCNHHIALDICSSSGMIATAGCPADQLLQKTYIIGGSTDTLDAPYIASQSFLSSVCTTHASDAPVQTPNTEGDNPSDSESSSEKPSESETPGDSENTSEKPSESETPSDSENTSEKPSESETPSDGENTSEKPSEGENSSESTNNDDENTNENNNDDGAPNSNDVP